MNHVSKADKPRNLYEIEEVGSFDLDALKGKSKEDLAKHFDGFTDDEIKAHTEDLYAALNGQQEQKSDVAKYEVEN